MTETSARFQLPLLIPGQAQKEMFHNEALSRIDMLLHPAVEAIDAVTPPAAPEVGQSWIVGANASGDWATVAAGSIASWTAGGWRIAAPTAGMTVWIVQLSTVARYRSGWQVVGKLDNPSGGAVVDIEARQTLVALLDLMRSQGLVRA